LLAPEEAFPDATADEWAAARRIDPAAFADDGAWHLKFHCFVVRGPRRRVALIDTGVGPAGSPASSWAPVPGRLLEALDEIGVAPRDVDLVVQTHLHSDHLGWAVTSDGVPVFPNARYVVQRAEVAALEEGGSPLVPYVVEPLRGTGQLHEVDGSEALIEGPGRVGHRLETVATPGHTPGHQSVVVNDGAGHLIITGDALVHAVQLANPDVAYAFEQDKEVARATRHSLLADAWRQNALLATAHLNRAFIQPRRTR
jgi:glyoxylase-like metal-dependent hydrolase (beta-lactamase superfamily II)